MSIMIELNSTTVLLPSTVITPAISPVFMFVGWRTSQSSWRKSCGVRERDRQPWRWGSPLWQLMTGECLLTLLSTFCLTVSNYKQWRSEHYRLKVHITFSNKSEYSGYLWSRKLRFQGFVWLGGTTCHIFFATQIFFKNHLTHHFQNVREYHVSWALAICEVEFCCLCLYVKR